jgi:hypothetical protein
MSELPELQQKAVDLLDILQRNLPDKTGEKAKWNFEKAHSILHKVREIVLWGNSDNCQGSHPGGGKRDRLLWHSRKKEPSESSARRAGSARPPT